MKPKNWFQKETGPAKLLAQKSPAQKRLAQKHPALLGQPLPARPGQISEAAKFASRLRPAELIAMLTHHFIRARARSQPRVKTSLNVVNTRGKQAVTISFG
jgi:hypothetical protein